MHKFDLVITNAKIVDGTGNPWYIGDVGINNGKISYIGKLQVENYADKVIDAKKQVLAPGFIDSHTHSDFALLKDPTMLLKIKQGVTTQIIGACGISAAPISPERVILFEQYIRNQKAGSEPDYKWESLDEFLNIIEDLPLGTNVGSYVGHGTIRLNVMGFDPRVPNKEEIDEMKNQITKAMMDGAFGLTTGLIYPPGVYSQPEEIEEIAKALKEFNGLYLSHMRNESYDSINSVKEVIKVGKVANIPVQIHHHKVMGIKNWGLVKETISLIEEARKEGVDITIDQYPYTACSTNIRACLPPWVHEGGLDKTIERLQDPDIREQIKKEINTNEEWENFYKNTNGAKGILISNTPETPKYEGKTLDEVSQILGIDPLEALFDIIIANKGFDTACYYVLSEEDVEYVMKNPLTMIASDSIPVAQDAKCHPRVNGSFPRVLGKYVRENKTLTLENAINKMTGFPATRLNIKGKGFIKEGMDADIVIFDEEIIIDGADFEDPFKEPKGINYVLINGKIILEDGSFTGRREGKVLRKIKSC